MHFTQVWQRELCSCRRFKILDAGVCEVILAAVARPPHLLAGLGAALLQMLTLRHAGGDGLSTCRSVLGK